MKSNYDKTRERCRFADKCVERAAGIEYGVKRQKARKIEFGARAD